MSFLLIFQKYQAKFWKKRDRIRRSRSRGSGGCEPTPRTRVRARFHKRFLRLCLLPCFPHPRPPLKWEWVCWHEEGSVLSIHRLQVKDPAISHCLRQFLRINFEVRFAKYLKNVKVVCDVVLWALRDMWLTEKMLVVLAFVFEDNRNWPESLPRKNDDNWDLQ